MLVAAKRLYGCSIVGVDGKVGEINDLLFDDGQWKVRYLDVNAGHRRAILAPTVVQKADYASRALTVPYTQGQVSDSPPVKPDAPVSRQEEIELARYYEWDTYWTHSAANVEDSRVGGEPILRSTRDISGFYVQVLDGELGHIDDCIVDDAVPEDRFWQVRYWVVDMRNWIPERYILAVPSWADSIDWEARRIEIGLTREVIEQSPEYDPDTPINRQYEEVLYDYYGRPKYWSATDQTP